MRKGTEVVARNAVGKSFKCRTFIQKWLLNVGHARQILRNRENNNDENASRKCYYYVVEGVYEMIIEDYSGTRVLKKSQRTGFSCRFYRAEDTVLTMGRIGTCER